MVAEVFGWSFKPTLLSLGLEVWAVDLFGFASVAAEPTATEAV